MSSISREDYIKLLKEIVDEQYERDEDSSVAGSIPDDAWIWADPPAKDKIKNINTYGAINITKLKKSKIKETLYKYMNLQIGNFLIRIKKYHGHPDKFGNGVNLSLDIEIWERKFKTPSGRPCSMDFRANLLQDDRFIGQPWLFSITDEGKANNMPVETVVDIIRWMQAIKKLPAFL